MTSNLKNKKKDQKCKDNDHKGVDPTAEVLSEAEDEGGEQTIISQQKNN